MSFLREERRNPDFTEASFVEFKNLGGEKVEFDLVPVDMAVHEVLPDPLSPQRLASEDEAIAFKLGPWGYSFFFSPGFNSKQVDQERFGAHPEQIGWNETVIRNSMYTHALNTFCKSGRWLDIATNCGFVPMTLSRLGQFHIDGNDLSPQNIEKANFLKRIGGFGNCSFEVDDAYSHLAKLPDNSYDIITAFGIFYHLSDPLGLAKLVFEKTRRVAMIETVVQNFPFSGWFQTVSRHVKYSELEHANDTRKIFELHPTFRGMIDTLYQVGFQTVREVVPTGEILNRYPGTIFSSRNRRLLVAIKS